MGNTDTHTPPKPTTSRRARPEIIGQADTEHGFTVLGMAMYKGRRRRYWWHCGGCWMTCEPSTDPDDVDLQAKHHLWLCTGEVAAADVAVLPAEAAPLSIAA
ncbi:hypothetical protein [Streptomyces osmaniensis]|uniref:Uncharacterized protein n=1 Tax=Streptomyces osmaniensis TaxID=593134 RepID=A0ABP6YZZ9_9ACTN|nr:hypothetical protein KJK32_45370 [Streptomyces sp. JCM17656]